jgi:two-component system, OmpR family, alkaline phosphatase synthesis response regulator PhoP
MIRCKERDKILIADDDTKFLDILKDMLVPNGFDVILVKDGTEAIKKAYDEKPGLILMDIMMPSVDGYTACNILKSDDRTKDIPLVMITGIGFELNKRYSQLLNADGYLIKPVSLEVLIATITHFL